MSTVYDAKIIQEFADRLYKKASSIVLTVTLLGIIIGGLFGAVSEDLVFASIFALVGGVVGFLIGRERAFAYKLQAQTALCQTQIERNTQSGQ